jgi:hypothetical protein
MGHLPKPFEPLAFRNPEFLTPYCSLFLESSMTEMELATVTSLLLLQGHA